MQAVTLGEGVRTDNAAYVGIIEVKKVFFQKGLR